VTSSILILDPDDHTRGRIASLLAENGFEVESICSSSEWIGRLPGPGPEPEPEPGSERPALLLVDAGQVPATFLGEKLSIPVLYLVPPGLEATDISEPHPLCYGYVEKNSESAAVVLRTVQAALQRRERERTTDYERHAYRFFFERIPIAAIVSDPGYVVRHWNRGAEELFGYGEHEAVGRVLMELLYSPRNEMTAGGLKQWLVDSLAVNHVSRNVNYDRTKDGRDILCEWHDYPYREGDRHYVLSVATDITQRRELIETLQATIEQKDFLTRENYHRLKNNLNMLNSLISLKIDEVEAKDPVHAEASVEVLRDIRQKLAAVSMLYEMLHEHGGGASTVDLSRYLAELTRTIFSSMSDEPCRIEEELDEVLVSPQTAVVLGLITNEIATNALKHGFLPGGERRFSLTLRVEEGAAGEASTPSSGNRAGTMCEYRLENSGRPFPEEVDFTSTTSLGLRLVHSLAEQLGAIIELRRSPSTCVTLRFVAG
jgi:PAS domain S-box-containing protein